MLTNAFDFWILARLVVGATAMLLCLVGVVVGARVVVQWERGDSGERQLALERQAELVATLMMVAAFLAVLGFALTAVVADRLVGGIRGAMCAFGVLSSTASGFESLFFSYLAAAACALWLILHRLDMRLAAPVLTPWKLLALVLVAPLVCVDFYLVVAFATQLDLTVIASCCSVTLDGAGAGAGTAELRLPPVQAGLVGLGAVAAAGVSAVAVWLRPDRIAAIFASACSAVAPLALLPAIEWVVAPHALGTPTHPCPFCLLHEQGGGIGWPLYAAIFSGSVLGMGVGIVEICSGESGAREAVRSMQKSLGRWAAIAWACALAVGAYPVVRYLLSSGGVPVFGEI